MQAHHSTTCPCCCFQHGSSRTPEPSRTSTRSACRAEFGRSSCTQPQRRHPRRCYRHGWAGATMEIHPIAVWGCPSSVGPQHRRDHNKSNCGTPCERMVFMQSPEDQHLTYHLMILTPNLT